MPVFGDTRDAARERVAWRPFADGLVVDKQFLGWSRVALSGGETGWVRSEALVQLYRS